ncbi:MAG: IclR family transcriptional regulator [Pusillimonas sp.]
MVESAVTSERKTIDKAMRLLNEFSHDRRELAVTDLAELLGMHKSVVSRLASSLKQWGMLEQNPVTGRLRIGSMAMRIGALFQQRNVLAEIAMPLLADLVNTTRHSAHLSILDGLRILVVATIESPSALRVIMRVGDIRDLHTTAAGKLFLAFSDASLFDAAYRSTGFRATTPKTISDRNELHNSLTRIRRNRWAANQGENTVGAGAFSAPITDRKERVVAAVSTVFPMGAVDKDELENIRRHTIECADQLSRRLENLD